MKRHQFSTYAVQRRATRRSQDAADDAYHAEQARKRREAEAQAAEAKPQQQDQTIGETRMADKVQRMHVAVSSALEGISTMFKPGMKLSFIARMPGNPEADVLIGDDQEPLELIALVQRRFAASMISAASAPVEHDHSEGGHVD
jgi:hypothetical protein